MEKECTLDCLNIVMVDVGHLPAVWSNYAGPAPVFLRDLARLGSTA